MNDGAMEPNERQLVDRLRAEIETVVTVAPDAATAAKTAMRGRRHDLRTPLLGFATVAAAVAVVGFAVQFLPRAGGTGPHGTQNESGVDASPGADVVYLTAGEAVQARPTTPNLERAFSAAEQFAERNADDVGYPWIDPASNELVLSAATPKGRAMLEAADMGKFGVPVRIRDVRYSFGELQTIALAATDLHRENVAHAELIWATYPDQRDNRVVIRLQRLSDALVADLAHRFGADAIAIEILPGAPNAD